MLVTARPPGSLKPHPLNATIYDAERDDGDLRRSISEQGILSPLTIDQHGTILAGHRRWRVATALTLDTVPVIVRQISDPLEAERILIESNRQREKTPSERMHEADNLTRIFAEEARRRQLAGVTESGAGGRGRTNPVATLPQGLGKTREKVAEAIGMKPRTYAKTKKVFDAAKDTTAPEPVRAVAQQQMAALDAGETTPHAAEKALYEAETREKVRALPEGASLPDPFADKPLVKAARLVKNARQALKATADHLQTFTPEEMADAVELNGTPDYVTADLAQLGRWIADYQRAIKRRRSSLHVVS